MVTKSYSPSYDHSVEGQVRIRTVEPVRHMSTGDRLNEIGEILARGLQRLLARQSTPKSADFRESSLDISAGRSVHPEGLASEHGGCHSRS